MSEDVDVSNEKSNEEKSMVELSVVVRSRVLVLRSVKEGMLMGILANNSAAVASWIPRSPAAGASPP